MSSTATERPTREGPARQVRRSTGSRPSDEHLLDAAGAVFAEQGFAGATMATIAAAADSTKPTLYAHFGDKDALYRRLLEREAHRCRTWLVEAYARNSTLAAGPQVAADMAAFFDWAQAHPNGFATLFAATSSDIQQRLRNSVTAVIGERIREHLHGEIDAFVVDQLAAMLVGVAVSAAEEAVRAGRDLQAAGAFAARFAAEAVSGLLRQS